MSFKAETRKTGFMAFSEQILSFVGIRNFKQSPKQAKQGLQKPVGVFRVFLLTNLVN